MYWSVRTIALWRNIFKFPISTFPLKALLSNNSPSLLKNSSASLFTSPPTHLFVGRYCVIVCALWPDSPKVESSLPSYFDEAMQMLPKTGRDGLCCLRFKSYLHWRWESLLLADDPKNPKREEGTVGWGFVLFRSSFTCCTLGVLPVWRCSCCWCDWCCWLAGESSGESELLEWLSFSEVCREEEKEEKGTKRMLIKFEDYRLVKINICQIAWNISRRVWNVSKRYYSVLFSSQLRKTRFNWHCFCVKTTDSIIQCYFSN